MLVPFTTPFRGTRRRDRRRQFAPPPPPPPPVAPTLVAASYTPGTQTLRLEFDRAIDSSGLVGNQVLVDDSSTGVEYEATGAVTVVDAATIEVVMAEVQAMSIPATVLHASAGNGVVAADGGGAWAGVSALALPFG